MNDAFKSGANGAASAQAAQTTPAIPTEKYDVKEILDIFDAAQDITVKIVQVEKDGFQVSDLRALFDPALFLDVRSAIKGSKEIPAEFKDLDAEEVKLLTARAFEFVKAIADAAR